MQKRKVLIIDDDDVTRILTQMSLGADFDVISAASGQEALTLVQETKPDLILLDVLMPEMNGLTALLKLREHAGLGKTPVILITASPQSQEAQSCLALQPVGILTKPFNPKELSTQINEMMANLWPARKSVSVLIVDDVPLICDTVKMLLTQTDHTVVVGEANDGLEAVEICATVNPDIVLMDVEMPVMDGIEATHIIRTKNKQVKIIMLTSHDSDYHIFSSFAAGADGYILKNRFIETLRTAIDTVRLGSVWLDPAIARRILSFSAETAKERLDLEKLFTHQEIDKLNMVATCSGEACLVEPYFIEKLYKLAAVA